VIMSGKITFRRPNEALSCWGLSDLFLASGIIVTQSPGSASQMKQRSFATLSFDSKKLTPMGSHSAEGVL
jgi:hypothetical protein